jgi:S-adenosylmethionine decarboxylase
MHGCRPEQDRSPREVGRATIARLPNAGTEWLVDAEGCDPERLCDLGRLQRVCAELVEALGLRVIGEPQWHQFPSPEGRSEPGGVTGLYLLAESHLACHTFPEYRRATFNLYCCRPRPTWNWEEFLAQQLGAAEVVAQAIARGAFEGVSSAHKERRR